MSTKKSGGTSPGVASQAGKDLSNKSTPKQDRGPIASALAQTSKSKPAGGKK